MENLVVKGGNRLTGSVKTSGAKNAVLPIIAASILGNTPSRLEEIPALDDVRTICAVLNCLGIKVDASEPHVLNIDSTEITSCEAPYELVRCMRASFLVMGPLLARKGKARISQPGGCAIGTRPIDLHLKGFEALGVKIEQVHGYIEATAPNGLVGTTIYFDFPSVGATENVMMAAALAEGTTILENPAEEPEIVDLANYLNQMGAKIRGAGTNVIRIEGVKELHGADHTVIPDRIEAGTYMIAAAMTGGDIVVENVLTEHQKPLIAKLREAGVTVEEDVDRVRVVGGEKLKAIDIKTLPYPGFPTDMQAQMMAMMAIAEGRSKVTETVFENRFMHVVHLKPYGSSILPKVAVQLLMVRQSLQVSGAGNGSTCRGSNDLTGLVAEGTTRFVNIYHIDRGYEEIVAKLQD